jgi:tetratricopeptide (TPR) repeat protein
MASRINVKFVVLLTAFFLVASGAVVGSAYMVLSKSGDNYAAMGDEALAAGDYQRAAEMYGRAVGHDRTRVDWLEKWRDALAQTTPETTAEYVKAYNEQYIGILTQLATLQPNEVDAQVDLLGELYDRVWWLFRSAEAWQSMIDRANRAIDRLGEDAPDAAELRRYRGLAGLEQMRQFDPSETERERTLADLRASIEAEPDDVEVAAALARWHMLQWRSFRRARQVEQADEYEDVVVAQIESLLERFPDSPLAQVAALELQIERGLIAANTYAARRAAMRGLRGSEERMIAVFDACPVDQLDGPLMSRFVRLLRGLRPQDPDEPVIRVCERILADRPDDPQIRLVLVGAFQQAGIYERAIEEAEHVASAPDLPLSLQGLLLRELRNRAVSAQAENSLGLWEQASSSQRRAELRDQLNAYRSRLIDMVPAGKDSPRVLMLDARIALSEERYQAALAAIEQYRRSTGAEQDAEVLRLTTRALLGDNQLGAAREKVEELLNIEPDNTQALLLAAEIDRRLLEPEKAVDRLRLAVELEPENVAFQQALGAALAASGIRPENDPVLEALFEVGEQVAADPATIEDGIARLEGIAAEHPGDARPLIALVELHERRNDRDAALEVVNRALEIFPDSPRLATIQRRLMADDPVELALARIDDSNLPEIEKILRKRVVLAEFGREDEAAALYEQAKEMDPDSRLILEIDMGDAISSGDMEAAERIAQRAAETNADEVDGALFEALPAQGRGNHEAAAEILERVLARLPYSGRGWQMLGQSQLALGQVTEAVESLRRSFDSRPDDIRAAQSLVGALLQLQRLPEALEIARRSAELNPGSGRAWTLRLELEEAAGDRELVIRERQRLLELNPGDQSNRIALIRTLTATGRFDEAAALIDETAQEFGDSLELALREALLLGAQDQVEAGRQRLVSFIESDDDAGIDGYVTLADFLLAADRPDQAVEALREARPLQSESVHEIDRMLGDTLFELGRYEEAVEPYRSIVDAGGADTEAVSKRLAETLLRLDRFDEATAIVDGLGGPGDDDAEVLLLRAEIALGRGNEREGQELLNAAVAAAPNNPLPFVRRARANIDDPDRDNEVMDDLEQALRLQPNLVIARQLRATVLARRGRVAEAASELQAAVEANPRNTELRATLIGYLVQNRSWTQAISVAEGGVAVSSRAPEWLRAAADVYAVAAGSPGNERDANRYLGSAASLLREAFARSGDQPTAVRLLEVVMNLQPPAANEALDLLAQLPAEVTSLPRFQLLSARAKSTLGRTGEALVDARAAFTGLSTVNEMRLWFAEVGRMFATPLETAQFARELTPPAELEPIYQVQLSALESLDVGRRSELIDRLRVVEGRTEDPSTLVSLYRLRSRLEYQAGDYEAAAETLKAGRTLAPDDSEFNNNLAFVLAKHLGDVDAALAPAQKAAELTPNDANVLDTLGWIYLRTGQLAQAQALLQQAVERASTPGVTVPANIHLAEVYLMNEEFPAARRHIERARSAIRLAPELAEEYQPELDSLIQRLDQAEG